MRSESQPVVPGEIRNSGDDGLVSSRSSSNRQPISSEEPATYVHGRSISLATHHEWSAGHHKFGVCSRLLDISIEMALSRAPSNIPYSLWGNSSNFLGCAIPGTDIGGEPSGTKTEPAKVSNPKSEETFLSRRSERGQILN